MSSVLRYFFGLFNYNPVRSFGSCLPNLTIPRALVVSESLGGRGRTVKQTRVNQIKPGWAGALWAKQLWADWAISAKKTQSFPTLICVNASNHSI